MELACSSQVPAITVSTLAGNARKTHLRRSRLFGKQNAPSLRAHPRRKHTMRHKCASQSNAAAASAAETEAEHRPPDPAEPPPLSLSSLHLPPLPSSPDPTEEPPLSLPSLHLPPLPSSSRKSSRKGAPSWTRFVPLQRTFPKIMVFLEPQIPKILGAWACAAVSVYALAVFVPNIGELSSLAIAKNPSMVGRKAAFAIALIAAKSIAQYWQQTLLWNVSLGMTDDIRSYVFDNLLAKNMGFFEGPDGAAKGDIAYRITAEADCAGDTVYALLNMLVPCTLQLGAMSRQMISLSPLLSLATVSVVPLMSLVIAVLGVKLRDIAKRCQLTSADLSAYLNEVLPSMLIVKACGGEALERRRFRRLSTADYESHFAKQKMKALIPEVITAVYSATGVTLFALGTWFAAKGKCDAKSLASFITSLVFLVDPIQQIGKAYNGIKQGEPAVERLFELTSSLSPQTIKNSDLRPLKNVLGDVTFLNVSFSYGENSARVLSDISLHVRPGETVALVGPSGGGKTTLAKLILRLYDPVQGKILIDGQDTRSFDLQSFRQHIGVVPQETVLFSGTVAENIAYGVLPEDIDMERVREAALQSNADEFVRRLPGGYNTTLGERGLGLSGGQRQRLAIARAIYHKPSILILDEATSALDNTSERLVSESLEKLMIDRTVFVIAHRLETIKKADRILLLEGGRLVEEGTHLSLLARGGQYASLFKGDDMQLLASSK